MTLSDRMSKHAKEAFTGMQGKAAVMYGIHMVGADINNKQFEDPSEEDAGMFAYKLVGVMDRNGFDVVGRKLQTVYQNPEHFWETVALHDVDQLGKAAVDRNRYVQLASRKIELAEVFPQFKRGLIRQLTDQGMPGYIGQRIARINSNSIPLEVALFRTWNHTNAALEEDGIKSLIQFTQNFDSGATERVDYDCGYCESSGSILLPSSVFMPTNIPYNCGNCAAPVGEKKYS